MVDPTVGSPLVPSALPRLVPVELAPARPSGPFRGLNSVASTALSRVTNVEIREMVNVDGKTHYVLHVYAQPNGSRLPLAVALGRSGSTASKPPPVSTHVYRFRAFRKLREDVYLAAREGHDRGQGVTQSCSFCLGVVDAVLLGETQPHLYDVWFRHSLDVCSRLEAFMGDLLARARGDAGSAAAGAERRRPGPITARPRCVVQARVQALLVEFLQLDPPTSSVEQA